MHLGQTMDQLLGSLLCLGHFWVEFQDQKKGLARQCFQRFCQGSLNMFPTPQLLLLLRSVLDHHT